MYNIIISVCAGVVFGLGLSFLPWMHWGFAAMFGVIAAMAVMIILSRLMLKRLEPVMLKAQKQAQARQFKLAIATLEELLLLGRWQIMLKGQILAQMGVIHYTDKNEEMAFQCLEKANPRLYDARLILASMHFRKKNLARMKEVMDLTISLCKKQVILYNAYAYMLEKSGEREAAIAALQSGLKRNPGNEATGDNLLRLQNNKKMNMKPFGMTWYSLQLERPPVSMLQDQFSGKPGFRQARKGAR